MGQGRGSFSFTATPRTTLPREVAILSTIAGNVGDLREVLDLARGGKVSATTTAYGLEDVEKAFADLRAGTITGRAVIAP